MKRLVILAVALAMFTGLYAQSRFLKLQTGYSFESANSTSGWSVYSTYSQRFLGLFRVGIGLEGHSFMQTVDNVLAHQSSLDGNVQFGLGLKLFGIRLEGGIGAFLGRWDKSFMADSTNSGYTVAGKWHNLNPGQYASYKYPDFGYLVYLNAGIDIQHRWGIFAFANFEQDVYGESITTLGLGLDFFLNR
jgi:hypothetical protein